MTYEEFISIVGKKIFTVEFIKRSDGKVRVLNGRLGVHKGLKGEGQRYDPASRGLVTVYDLKNEGYRMIPLESIQKLKANKKLYDGTNSSDTR